MTLDVVILMDPIEAIDIRGDSTFALGLEAQARGFAVSCCTPGDLALRDGRLWAQARPVHLRDEVGAHVRAGAAHRRDLAGADVVLMRQDPPFDMAYITATYLLETIHPATLVVNAPAAVRNTPEKLFAARFADLMPPTLVASSLDEIAAFRREFRDLVIKPLHGHGGAGVFRLRAGDQNLRPLLELFGEHDGGPVMVQQYLPAVRLGDKRILLVAGAPVATLLRLPPPGQMRSNLHVGGTPQAGELEARDLEICACVGPVLAQRGIVFAGLDVIGGFLTEVNVTSPTCIREVVRLGGPDAAVLVWDAIEARLAAPEPSAAPAPDALRPPG